VLPWLSLPPPCLPVSPSKEEVLLGEIRDLLKAQNDKPL